MVWRKTMMALCMAMCEKSRAEIFRSGSVLKVFSREITASSLVTSSLPIFSSTIFVDR